MSSLAVRKRRDVGLSPPEALPGACAIVIPEHDLVVPASALTLPGFRAWAQSDEFPERGRISFLNQELYIDMSPEEIETHNKVKSEVGYTLVGMNKKRKLGEFYADRVLVTNVEANLSTEPDASFATWLTIESGRIRFIPREGAQGQYIELEGTPDWVLEIVSKTSVRKDTRLLRERYYRAGVSEFWLIDARGEDINFQILIRGETDYEPAPRRNGWQESKVFGTRFRLVRRRGRLNRWEYTLERKALR